MLPERTRFMKGIFAWVGFSTTTVWFDREARVAGTTNWNYWKLWKFALDGIFSFTTVPLKHMDLYRRAHFTRLFFLGDGYHHRYGRSFFGNSGGRLPVAHG